MATKDLQMATKGLQMTINDLLMAFEGLLGAFRGPLEASRWSLWASEELCVALRQKLRQPGAIQETIRCYDGQELRIFARR